MLRVWIGRGKDKIKTIHFSYWNIETPRYGNCVTVSALMPCTLKGQSVIEISQRVSAYAWG